MILKIISLFLIAMVALAIFGRLKLPRGRIIRIKKPLKCPKCGNFIFGSVSCRCDLPEE